MVHAAKTVEEEGKLEPGETLEFFKVYNLLLGLARVQDHRVVGKPV